MPLRRNQKHTFSSSKANVKHSGSGMNNKGGPTPKPMLVNNAHLMGELMPPPEWPHPAPPLSMSAFPKSETEPTSYHSMTITDDHSKGSDIKRRKLMAVSVEENPINPPGFPSRLTSGYDHSEQPNPTSSSQPAEGQSVPTGLDLDFSALDNPDILESFDFDTFLNTDEYGTGFGLEPNMPHTDEARSDLTYPPPWASKKSEVKRRPTSKVRMEPESGSNSKASYGHATGMSSISSEAVDDNGRAEHHSNGTEAVEEVQRLRDRIVELESQLQNSAGNKQRRKPPRLQVLYRLQDGDPGGFSNDDTPFEDEPEITQDKEDIACLRCRNRVSNLELYLMRHPDISFVVFRTYPKTIHLEGIKGHHCSNPIDQLRLPSPVAESILPVERNLKQALNMVLERKPEFRQILDKYLETDGLDAPYLFIYHSRSDLEDIRSHLSPEASKQLGLLVGYVKSTLGREYHAADEIFKKGKMAPGYIQYLVKPGDVLVEKLGKGYTGFIAESWLSSMQKSPSTSSTSPGEQGSIVLPHFPEGSQSEFGIAEEMKDESFILEHPIDLRPLQSRMKYTWTFMGKTLGFNGSFFWKTSQLKIEMSADSLQEPSAIANMNVFPLRYAPGEISEMLQRRGSMFWKCRTKNLISYQPGDDDEFSKMTDDRYMIDMRTFRTLHPHNTISLGKTGGNLSLDVIREDERFQYLLPPLIKGYNLRRKAWNDLAVDRISDVKWNREAFHSLVIEHKAKNLIEALVVSQLEEEKSTDLISGKGNGLILLFHGGPGTGKTLTAEGVAEIAKKPLYRVTCGDVGTKAEEVEKYLDSVLHLGRIWDCVVLLDEADVFLEQRSLEDLQRNALVSVFLRVLEYYEGILILTSNRVGTFDEAFISRIQLALHYPDLGPRQRRQIWQTFVDRLENLDEDIDFANLRDNLDALKLENLNGRQIRNVITTARQCAKWKNTTLTYEHLKDVIEISGRFGTYLHDLRGFSENELAKDGGIR
ncbi:uncharacterized protein N7477_000224 [Penicillium maclennaniae]|uniref:uncharacterized protein n=1 Tax=Penicillium maclennaniae TaxID=1343394 RepID=UPI00254047AB|nr:uncharacterized protein N7477_000224 [Penicillium maclennaniae]KAJ5683879.1 hypothetical protein N7477_000224 [Penicillium maclennaniae]